MTVQTLVVDRPRLLLGGLARTFQGRYDCAIAAQTATWQAQVGKDFAVIAATCENRSMLTEARRASAAGSGSVGRALRVDVLDERSPCNVVVTSCHTPARAHGHLLPSAARRSEGHG